MRRKVLVAYNRLILAPLSQLEDLATVEVYFPRNEKEWKDKIRDINILIPPDEKMPDNILESGAALEMIQTFSIGYNNININVPTEKGILVCNVAEIVSESVAQLTWAHILALSRRITNADKAVRSGYFMKPGKWGAMQEEDMYFYRRGPLLWGKTLGLVGLGDIGSRVALKGLHAFNMRILVYDPFILPARAQMYGAELVSLQTVLKESDFISIHCPLNKDTYHLIGEKELKMMKKSSFIVNTARGPIIDEKALIKALENGTIAGAGLDTYEEEPLFPDSPLLKLENTVLTPHIGSVVESLQKMHEGALENISRYLKGEKPFWIVNPTAVDK